jgi:uncharacterized membrane protein YhhN
MLGPLADAIVLIHFAFVLFILLGGLLVLRWPGLVWLHLPIAAWGVLVQCMGWICPLTPLENWLRLSAGGARYQGGFVEHYVIPLLYPLRVGPRLHLALGALVFALNAVVYASVLVRARRRRTKG